MHKSSALPFDPTPESLSVWLLSFDKLFLAEKVNLLNGVLSELTKAQIEKDVLFEMLDKLTDSVLLLSKLLEHNAKRSDYSPDKAKKWKIASIQLSKKLGFAYAHLAKAAELPETAREVCAYRAMQILCLLSKRIAVFHEPPDSSLWKKFAELYLLGETEQWLERTIEDRVPGLFKHPTLDAIAKHALLFHSCLPYRYGSSAIAAIFTATAELVPHVRLGQETPDFALCRWQPDDLLPPECTPKDSDQSRELSLDVGGLIDFFENRPDKQTELEAYPGLLHRLTAYYEIRRSVDPLNAKTCGLIIGSAPSAKFLNLLISRYRVMELSGIHQSQPTASRMELVPLEIRNTMASLSSKFFADVKNVSASQLTIFATRDRAFCVTKTADTSRSKDESAIIIQDGKPPCFAVIRNIRADSNAKLRNLLLEKFEGEIYPVEIEKNQGFILIRSENEYAELFLPPEQKYENAAVLAIARGIIDASVKIEKFLELNAHFVRYEVCFC